MPLIVSPVVLLILHTTPFVPAFLITLIFPDVPKFIALVKLPVASKLFSNVVFVDRDKEKLFKFRVPELRLYL